MQVAVLGINHKGASVALRECLYHALKKTHENTSQSVHLSTCNRTELYFSGPHLSKMHSEILQTLYENIEEKSFDQKLYSFFGIDCFRHLAKVTLGLDSLIPFETEIQGQVRKCYVECQGRPLGKDLHFLFQKSLRIAKKIRTLFPHTQKEGLETILCERINRCNLPKAKILFIGASQINEKIYTALASSNHKLYLSNRSNVEKARFEQAIRTPFEKLSMFHLFDIVIIATKSKEPLLFYDPTFQRVPKAIFDLSVPRNASSCLYDLGIVEGIDTLQKTDQAEGHASMQFLLRKKQVEEEVGRLSVLFERKKRIPLSSLSKRAVSV